jgi:hypothetical protein
MRMQVLFTVGLVPTTLLGGCIINLGAGSASGGDTTSQTSAGGGAGVGTRLGRRGKGRLGSM